jgi:hypothetical protein
MPALTGQRVAVPDGQKCNSEEYTHVSGGCHWKPSQIKVNQLKLVFFMAQAL